MNGHYSRWCARMVCMVLLLAPVFALAQSPYEGLYIGTFEGTRNAGEFAVIVDSQGYGTLAAYDSVDDIGYIERNIRIRSDGSFQFLTLRGAHIDGQITASGISGSYFADGSYASETHGSFAGQRSADDGPFAEAAGYYSGLVDYPGFGFGADKRLVAFIGADGRAFFLHTSVFAEPAGYLPGNLVFDYDLDLGFGIDLDFGLGFNSSSTSNWGGCAPFGFGIGYSFSISILGFIDFDVDYNLPSCGFSWAWNQVPGQWNFFGGGWNGAMSHLIDSGGIIQIKPDGVIDGMLLDGVILQGQLDAPTASAEGTVSGHQGLNPPTGHFEITRTGSPANLYIEQHYKRLPDLDGDGNADVIWQHTVTGENAVWIMDGTSVMAELPVELPEEIQADPQWSLALVTELNNDGQSDMVWRHVSTGELFVMFSSNDNPVQIVLDPAWQIVGSGDFSADAGSDIIVNNPRTGENGVIGSLLNDTSLAPLPAMEDRAWSFATTADFDGDRRPDVLWVNRETSELLIWLMNGRMVMNKRYLFAEPSGRDELAGFGDFDADGAMDILWRDDSNGDINVTLKPVEGSAEDVLLGEGVARAWQLAAIGDVNGDGTDDLVWRHNATGETIVWQIGDVQLTVNAMIRQIPDLRWMIRP